MIIISIGPDSEKSWFATMFRDNMSSYYFDKAASGEDAEVSGMADRPLN
jgi:hypothetical protein